MRYWGSKPLTHIWVAVDGIAGVTRAKYENKNFLKLPYTQKLYQWLFSRTQFLLMGQGTFKDFDPNNPKKFTMRETYYTGLALRREEDLRDFLLLVKFEKFES